MNDFESIASRLKALADSLTDEIDTVVQSIAAETVVDVASGWSQDTGTSANSWRTEQIAKAHWQVKNDTDYAQFVFRKGDKSRTPIYESRLTDAVEKASADRAIDLLLSDITEKYIPKS